MGKNLKQVSRPRQINHKNCKLDTLFHSFVLKAILVPYILVIERQITRILHVNIINPINWQTALPPISFCSFHINLYLQVCD